MTRNLFISLTVAIVITWAYVIAPAPMRCHSQGCVADIVGRWESLPPVAHVTRFLFSFGGLFALLQWIAPWAGRVRHRARMRLWHSHRDS